MNRRRIDQALLTPAFAGYMITWLGGFREGRETLSQSGRGPESLFISLTCPIRLGDRTMKRLGRIVGLATELGMTMGLTAAGFVIVGLWAGRWLDAKLGTSYLATLLLLVVGALPRPVRG